MGRNMPIGDIEPYADGRVMNGSSALESKLIDGIGGLESAIAKAKELAELPEDAAVYDEIRHPLEQFLMSMENVFMRHSELERRLNVKHTMIEYRYQP